MLKRTLRRAAVLPMALLAFACGDATGAPDEARLRVSAAVGGSGAAALVVEVAAPDIAGRLAFNVPVRDGVASGVVSVPAGSARTLTVRAFDPRGAETHRGSRVIDVLPGTNPAVAITLYPVDGAAPITATVTGIVVSVSPASATLAVGATLRLEATVRDADGRAVDARAQWASLDPARATVDAQGLVTARDTGAVDVVAVHAGAGALARLRVTR
jgi:hypothetical protein